MKAWACTLVVAASIASPSQVIETKRGKLEFVGLEVWTPELIREKLGYKGFGDMHACAEALKSRLGFPEAAVIATDIGHGKLHFVISVIEPKERHRVVHSIPSSTVAVPPTWNEIMRVADEDPGGFLKELDIALRERAQTQAQTTVMRPKWLDDLDRFDHAADQALALEVVRSDACPGKQMAALAILSSFPHMDSTWHGLIVGCCDASDLATATANSVLHTLTYTPIDPGLAGYLSGQDGGYMA